MTLSFLLIFIYSICMAKIHLPILEFAKALIDVKGSLSIEHEGNVEKFEIFRLMLSLVCLF